MFFLCSLFLLYVYFTNNKCLNYDIIWKENIARSDNYTGNVKYNILNGNIIRYSNDGVRYFDSNGKQKFNVSYNIKSPVCVINNKYFAISGVTDNSIYIFNEEGLIGVAQTDFPIIKIKISESGIVYALLDVGSNSIITLFDRFGNPIDISIMSVLSGDGMPIDFDISPSGAELVVSYSFFDNNEFKTRVVYYNFDEIGKSANNNRVVGGFESEFENHIVARVKFFDENNSVCVFDGGLCFISTKILSSPKISKKIIYDEMIKSISINDTYIAVVLEKDNESQLIFYDKTGRQLFKKDLSISYDNFYITNDNIVFTDDNNIKIFNRFGRLRFDRIFDESITYIEKINNLMSNKYVIANTDIIENIIIR